MFVKKPYNYKEEKPKKEILYNLRLGEIKTQFFLKHLLILLTLANWLYFYLLF